jgi:ketosteroid isomerase-like protein
MTPSAPVQEGKPACSAFPREVLPSLLREFERHIDYTSAEVRVLGDAAYDRGTFAFSVVQRADGWSETSTRKYLWLYARSDGTWKLTRVIVCLDESAVQSVSESA